MVRGSAGYPEVAHGDNDEDGGRKERMKLQHLVFSSNQLKGSRTFADWNIQKELTLYPMPQTHRVCCMSM